MSLPAITRKTDKGLPRYQDAEESDVYVLSGAEDLVPVLQADGARFQDSAPGYANKLPARLMTGKFGIGLQTMRPGFGFGYDVAVFEDPLAAGTTAGRGSYLWDGAAGTWFLIDPSNDVVFVGMIQRMLAPGMRDYEQLSRALTYQALVDRRK